MLPTENSPQHGAPGPEGRLLRRSVAILLFDDVEVLDFAGPFEVFGVARSADGSDAFKVVTIALRCGEITARNGLRIVPTLTAAALVDVDILVIPGGPGTRREMMRPAMLEFVRKASGAAELTLSVCTGALLSAPLGFWRARVPRRTGPRSMNSGP